jgi:hypothetical protein
VNNTPITFALTRNKELALMRICVEEKMTLGEKLNDLVDAFLRQEVKLTSARKRGKKVA